eukprot:8719929-Pyramimonas_sp.AAC.1
MASTSCVLFHFAAMFIAFIAAFIRSRQVGGRCVSLDIFCPYFSDPLSHVCGVAMRNRLALLSLRFGASSHA